MASTTMLDVLRTVDDPSVERSVAQVGAALLAGESFESHELFGVRADHICSDLNKLELYTRVVPCTLLVHMHVSYKLKISHCLCVQK